MRCLVDFVTVTPNFCDSLRHCVCSLSVSVTLWDIVSVAWVFVDYWLWAFSWRHGNPSQLRWWYSPWLSPGLVSAQQLYQQLLVANQEELYTNLIPVKLSTKHTQRESGYTAGVRIYGGSPAIRREPGYTAGARLYGGSPAVRRRPGGTAGVRLYGGSPAIRRESGGTAAVRLYGGSSAIGWLADWQQNYLRPISCFNPRLTRYGATRYSFAVPSCRVDRFRWRTSSYKPSHLIDVITHIAELPTL